jgi:hypothetical protein
MSVSLLLYQTAPFYRPLVSIHGTYADEMAVFTQYMIIIA